MKKEIIQMFYKVALKCQVGKIGVHLYSSSTKTEDGETENKGIKVEIDGESKTRFSQYNKEKKAWAKTVSSKEKALRMSWSRVLRKMVV